MAMILKYNTLYEYIPETIPYYLFLIPLGLVLFGFFGARYFKRHGLINPLNGQFYREQPVFGSIAMIVFGFILLIFFLIQAPKEISDISRINDVSKGNNFLIVEGEIENFHSIDTNYSKRESFIIDSVGFEYSDTPTSYGFNMNVNKSGIIRGDEKNLRIYYVNLDGKNIILKIEKLNTN